jgi:hypothetical protein
MATPAEIDMRPPRKTAGISNQKREVTRLATANDGLTNEIAQYKDAVGTLTNKPA